MGLLSTFDITTRRTRFSVSKHFNVQQPEKGLDVFLETMFGIS